MKRTILIFHNILWSHYKGRVFSELYKLAKQDGFDLKVIHIAINEKGRKNLGEVDKTVHQYPYKVLFEKTLEEVSLLQRVTKLLKVLFREEPDVVAIPGWNDLTYYLIAFITKIMGKKLIFQNDSTYFDRPRKWYKEIPKKLIIKLADAYWCYGTASKEYLLKLGATEDKVFIRCQATDFNYIDAVCKTFEGNKEKIKKENNLKPKNFIYVGRLSVGKNVEFLLKVFGSIKREFREAGDWGLIIVGDGPLRQEVEKFIKANNLEKDVYITGGMSWKEVPKFYAIADVFVLPSLSEPWGLVVNEAMICGLPVVVSKRAGAYWDLVKEGVNGFGFEPTNHEELKEIMLKFIRAEVDIVKMGEASREIIKPYTPENAAKQMLQAIKFALEE